MQDTYQRPQKRYEHSNGYRDNRYRNDNQQDSPEEFFKKSPFKPVWVSSGADAQLPDFAQSMGKYMADNGLTNSKIRSIYGEIKRIQMGDFEKERSSFYLLKPKVAYALGRDPHNKGLQLFKIVFDGAFQYVADHNTYHNFCNLIESILAYHKASGGKD